MTLERALQRRRRLRAVLAAADGSLPGPEEGVGPVRPSNSTVPGPSGRPHAAATAEAALAALDRILAELTALEVWIAKTAAATLVADGRSLTEVLAEQRRLRLRLVLLRRLRRRFPESGEMAVSQTIAECARLRRLIRQAARQAELADYSFIPTCLQVVVP